jgi:RNA polymerase sigma-70 factor (ECF subfamily)
MLDPDLARELESLHGRSFGWALSCCARDHVEAQEVLQEAYSKVLSGRARFDRRAVFRTWFFGVVRLTAFERRRWRKLRARDVPWSDIWDEPAAEPAGDRMAARALERCLRQLPDRQREVLHLVFYEDLTIAEAAKVMTVSLGTARVHYERGKASLLSRLREEGVQWP